MLRSLCPAVWSAGVNSAPFLRQQSGLCTQRVGSSPPDSFRLLTWLLCKFSTGTASQQPAIFLPCSHQYSRPRVGTFSLSYRNAHAKVAPRGRRGREEGVKKDVWEAEREKHSDAGRRRLKRRKKLVSASLRDSETHLEPPKLSSFSRLLRTSTSESEHMAWNSPLLQLLPASAAIVESPPRKPRRSRETVRSRGNKRQDIAEATSASDSPRRSRRMPRGKSHSRLWDDHSHNWDDPSHLWDGIQKLGKQRAPTGSKATLGSTAEHEGTSERVETSVPTFMQRWMKFFVQRLPSPLPPVVPPGQLTAATPKEQLQEAQIENAWQQDEATYLRPEHSLYTPSGVSQAVFRPLRELHSNARAATGLRKRIPRYNVALLDRCIELVQTQRLSDGCILQVVCDSALHAQTFRPLRVSNERDTALSRLHTLMSLAVSKSFREELSHPPASPATGPFAVPSRELLHALALSFALAKAGATSADYKKEVSKLLRRELELIAATPAAPFSLATATSTMQALAYSGSSSSDAQSARRLTADRCRSSVAASLCALAQHKTEVPVLTTWDWARFYVPEMGLFRGAYAALRAPAPLLHMHGLHVRIAGGRQASQYSLPRPVQEVIHVSESRGRAHVSRPWRVYAAWGSRDPVDTLVLLLHSFFVAHLRQTGLSNHPASLDPCAFSAKYQAVFDDEDKRFVQRIYSAFHALGTGNEGATFTCFPDKLLLADCISHKVGLFTAPVAFVSNQEQQTTSESHWDELAFSTSSINSVKKCHFDVKELMQLLRRLSFDQPTLRDRLFSSAHMVPAIRNRSDAQATLSAMRKQLTEEVPAGSDFGHVCTWLASKIGSQPTINYLILLRVAALEDAAHMCTWLKRVPDSVVRIHACLSNPTLRRYTRSKHSGVQHLPEHSCNKQVAQALQAALTKVPDGAAASLVKGVRKIVQIAQTVEAMKELQCAPEQARRAVRQMRDMKSLADICAPVPADNIPIEWQLHQIAGRVCHRARLSDSQYITINKILDSEMAKAGLVRGQRDKLVDGGDACQGVYGGDAWQGGGGAWELLQDVKELFMKAGCGAAVQGCRVTAAVAELSSLPTSHSNSKGGQGCLPEGLQQHCNNVLTTGHGRPSEMHKKIHVALQQLGYPVLSERQLPGIPMYVDVLTRGVDQAGEVHHVVLEVDGPTHFLHSPDGPPELSPVDELKAAALLLHGVPTIRVSYKDWERIGVSGMGLHHGEIQLSWLEKELHIRGIVGPIREDRCWNLGEESLFG